MFHLQSLELLHWDYCRRVSMPLDGNIITIAGPNGSGKTTLLDAMRTLLGLEFARACYAEALVMAEEAHSPPLAAEARAGLAR